MDKAARAVRRSSVKLMSLGGGHSDLHVLLSEVKDMRQTAKAFMNAQNTVSQDLLKWAANEENRALQDVANQLAELNLLWTEVQREFGENLKDYRHMFEMILEGEKHVAQSRNHFAGCEQREMKVRKELKKAFKKSSTSEIQSLEGSLAQAERAKHLAQIEVTDRIRENEAVKLIRLKEGLMKLGHAYSDFARKCAVVFDAQQDIVQELPDVLDQDLEDMKYTGTGMTRHRVQQAKEEVRNYRTRKDRSHYPQKYSEPPPPYSLTNDFEESSPSILCLPSTTSPRRRIATAADRLESKQQQRVVYSKDLQQHHHPLPSPPHPTTTTMTTATTHQAFDGLYPPIPCKFNVSSFTPPSTSNPSTSPPPSVVLSVCLSPPAPPLPLPNPTPTAISTTSSSPRLEAHLPSYHKFGPASAPSPSPQSSAAYPPVYLEASVPEVPADLRPVVAKPSYEEEEDDDDSNGRQCHHLQQVGVVGGLVDFDPTWDDGSQEHLSGAMGGAKI